VISDHNLQKLLDHNFIDLFTRDELKRACNSHPSRWCLIRDSLQDLIMEIESYELAHPLGLNKDPSIWVNVGVWYFDKKVFSHGSFKDVEFTLEELKFYYKLFSLLSVMDLS